MRVLILLLALSGCAHDAYYEKYCTQDTPWMANLRSCPQEAIDKHYKPKPRPPRTQAEIVQDRLDALEFQQGMDRDYNDAMRRSDDQYRDRQMQIMQDRIDRNP